MTNKLCLGRIHDTHRNTDLRFADYIDRVKLIESSQAPAAPNWEAVPTPSGSRPTKDRDPLGNTDNGDCVFAGPAHMVNLQAKLVGRPDICVTEEQALAEYYKRTGGPDVGYVIRDMIQIGKDEGLYGVHFLGAAMVDKNDPVEVALACWCGGGLIGGYDLPANWREQLDNGALWTRPAGGWAPGQGPSTNSGHCTFMPGTAPGGDQVNSWGILVGQEAEWRQDCCSELWLLLTDLWVTGGFAPNGFSAADLIADIRARGGI